MNALQKPAYGTPCNGCGRCCQEQLCPLAAAFYGTWAGPCSALEVDGLTMVCGFIRRPEAYAPVGCVLHGEDKMRKAAIYLTGAGLGCDARLVGETDAPPAYKRTVRKLKTSAARRRAQDALHLWVPEGP